MSWLPNEPAAASRRTLLIITDDGGIPINPGSDPIAAGAVFVVGVNAPNADVALGTCTNVRRALVIADFAFTAAITDVCTKVAHGLQTGDGPVRLTTTGTLPAGLALATDYYIIKIDADTFYLATTLANAYAGTRVDITDAGTGTHTVDITASTKRGVWGHFIYEATQAETNHAAKTTEIFVDGVIGGVSCPRMNGAGAHSQVEMDPAVATVWDHVIENGYTAKQLLRGIARQNLATRSIVGTVETTRDLANTKNSHTGTVTGSSRAAVINDLD